MVQNGIFWTIGEQSYMIDYPIMSYRKIKVYNVKKKNTRRYQRKNGVSGTILLEQWCQQKFNRGKYYGTYCTR